MCDFFTRSLRAALLEPMEASNRLMKNASLMAKGKGLMAEMRLF
jgi:hypothetical protein